MKKIVITLLIFIFALFPYNICDAKVSKEQLLEMQTNYYNTGDITAVIKSVITTLYDSDYVIEEFDEKLGFIHASKSFKTKYTNKKRVAGWSMVLIAASAYTAFSYGATAASMYSPTRRITNEMREKTVNIDINVIVEQTENNQTKVRFIPVEKILQNADGFSFMKSTPIKIFRIYNSDTYKEFFTQVEKNLILL